MKILSAMMAIVGTAMTAGVALASHPADPLHSNSVRQQSEIRHVHQGRLSGGQPAHAEVQLQSTPGHNVFRDGKYVGADPDPRIRSSLMRERIDQY